MRPEYLLFVLATAGMAEPQMILKTGRNAHVLVLDAVHLNGEGPFRMAIDSGAASCLIRPEVARRLGVRPAYAVEQVTAAGSRIVPVVELDEVRAGAAVDRTIEALIAEPALDGVDGVLGQSWLARHDYLLDYGNRRLVLGAAAPEGGVRAEVRLVDGRPAIAAEVDGRREELILDSGASVVVLFQPATRVQPLLLRTHAGSVAAERTTVRIAIGPGSGRRMAAVRVHAPEAAAGLLPLSAFASVYISNRGGFAVLTR